MAISERASQPDVSRTRYRPLRKYISRSIKVDALVAATNRANRRQGNGVSSQAICLLLVILPSITSSHSCLAILLNDSLTSSSPFRTKPPPTMVGESAGAARSGRCNRINRLSRREAGRLRQQLHAHLWDGRNAGVDNLHGRNGFGIKGR